MLPKIIKFILYIIDEIHTKYINKCSLYLYRNNQQCANQKGVAQKFTQVSSRMQVLSKRIRRVFEVFFTLKVGGHLPAQS